MNEKDWGQERKKKQQLVGIVMYHQILRGTWALFKRLLPLTLRDRRRLYSQGSSPLNLFSIYPVYPICLLGPLSLAYLLQVSLWSVKLLLSQTLNCSAEQIQEKTIKCNIITFGRVKLSRDVTSGLDHKSSLVVLGDCYILFHFRKKKSCGFLGPIQWNFSEATCKYTLM